MYLPLGTPMKLRFLIYALVVLFGIVSLVLGDHPAVCRVKCEHGQFTSYGSGTLIYKDEKTAYVLTCAHTYREALQSNTMRRSSVLFPENKQSRINHIADIEHIDFNADICILNIEPSIKADPVPLAADFKVGERAFIAGYGSGNYLAQSGQRIAFFDNPPNITISVAARQGDSGGPVFNERGELAGLLWGTDGQTTSAKNLTMLCSFFQQWNMPMCGPGGCGGGYFEQPQQRQPSVQAVVPRQRIDVPIAKANPPVAPPAATSSVPNGAPPVCCDGKCCKCFDDIVALKDRLSSLEKVSREHLTISQSINNDQVSITNRLNALENKCSSPEKPRPLTDPELDLIVKRVADKISGSITVEADVIPRKPSGQ